MKTPPEDSSIARRTVRGSAYSVGASAITIALGLIRTYLMVTYLLPEEVGLAALGLFWVDLVATFSTTGLNNAYIHRPEADETTRKTYFTFSLLISLATFLVTLLIIPLVVPFYPQFDGLGGIILAYAAISLLKIYNLPQVTFLNKDLSFGRIARLDVAGAVAATITGPLLAATGFGVWALVGEYAAGVAIRFLLLLAFKRSWRPRLGWDRGQAAWFWNYGKSIWMNSNLTFAIDNFDDFWVGLALGKVPLGLYNKAYEFSRYPRRVVAGPILSVFFPAFALLQADRTRLSRAFFRSASLMVRTSALFSLLVILAAPEVFTLFLPGVWQPMRLTFQLMIVYTILDPLALAANRLMLATGHPKIVTRIRWLQLAVFIPAVIGGAAWLGIEGVALAADLMMLVGVLLLFRAARHVVDYSASALWRWPILASALVVGATLGLEQAFSGASPALILAVKMAAIPTLFGLVLFLTEREQLLTGMQMIWGLVKPQKSTEGIDGESDDRRPGRGDF